MEGVSKNIPSGISIEKSLHANVRAYGRTEVRQSHHNFYL